MSSVTPEEASSSAWNYDNIDFSLMKAFPVWESLNFQFRAEFFNIFNIQNYGLPGTTFGGTGFGVTSSLTGAPLQGKYSSV